VAIYRKHLAMAAVDAMDAAIATPLSSVYFQQYYKDAIHRLNRDERWSFQLIHGLAASLNAQNERFGAESVKLYNELQGATREKIKKTIELWSEGVRSVYENARCLQWHIEYHLKHQKRPMLDPHGEANVLYTEFATGLPKEISSIMDEAKAAGREKVLHPQDWERLREGSKWTGTT
jgi:hypothetical protein